MTLFRTASLMARPALLLGFFISLMAPSVHGVLFIDEFTTTQVISGLDLNGSGFVSGPGILGTERDAVAYAPSIDINSALPGRFLAFNSHPQNWGTIHLTYDGTDHNTGGSYLNGLGDVDLTQGGINDRLRINVAAATCRGGVLSVTMRNLNWYGSSISVPLPATPALLDLRFADFQLGPPGALHSVNFADVGFIELTLELNPGESYVFGPIVSTIPEPSTAALVFLGLAALGLKQCRMVARPLRQDFVIR